MKRKSIIIISATTAAVLGLAGVTAGVAALNQNSADEARPVASQTALVSASPSPSPSVTSTSAVQPETPPAVIAQTTDELLVYLIEEEKLAHDVYTVLGGLWGSNVFTNILASETSHQDQVLALLAAHGIADPRSSEIGVFNDPELQALYDQLIAQGSVSLADAYAVGVAIEEKDIADLNVAMGTTTDAAVLGTLQTLLSGSENHLAAFSRKI
jgi:hypothetical protein